MYVYVIDQNGQPLMPTNRCGKVRRLLNLKEAKVVKRCPFTIQLCYEPETHVADGLTLGVDAGSKHIGLSVTSEKQEYYAGEVLTRTDIVGLLSTRREDRRTRRNRKTRYRKPRFDNRTVSKPKGWLAPSVEHKIQTHLTAVQKVCGILPISHITIEVASFDTQLLKAIDEEKQIPAGIDYQNGEKKEANLNGWNNREYVLFRDNHTCQCCKGKSKDPVLQVHHIESRKTGGDAPNNLITLCKTCHEKYHKGLLPNFKPERGESYRDGTFMGIMRRTTYNRLKELYPGKDVKLTYGFITKNNRIRKGIAKEHYNDAYCIAGNLNAKPLDYMYLQKKVRCHNRQLHKKTIGKGGYRKKNQAPYQVFGFRLFDKVEYNGQECFIFGRRVRGSINIRTLGDNTLNKDVTYKKLKLLETKKGLLIVKGKRQFLPSLEVTGSLACNL